MTDSQRSGCRDCDEGRLGWHEPSLVIVEGISGTWFYHWAPKDRYVKALCGAQTMTTNCPPESWGFVGHLKERYCKECERLCK